MDFLINAVLIVFRSEVCLVGILSQEPTFERGFGKMSLIMKRNKKKGAQKPSQHVRRPQADALPLNFNSISKHNLQRKLLTVRLPRAIVLYIVYPMASHR
jgi:hypothetical protein